MRRSNKPVASIQCLIGLVSLAVASVALAPRTSTAGEENSDEESAESTSEAEKTQYDTVERRETLATVALDHGVSVEQLESWNDVEAGELEPGMRLIVKSAEVVEKEEEQDDGPEPVVHRISRGDTLRGIAHKYGVSPAKVKRWNNHLNPRALQLGQHVRLYVPGSDGESVSYGAASGGRLFNGVPLKTTEGLDVRSVAHAYGTERVVRLLRTAAKDVTTRWPNTPPLVVGHLSYKKGGPMSPHKSHQSGRDADISYYYRGNVRTENFFEMTVQTFDARKNWHLFKSLVDSGQVEFIFISYYLQKPLYKYAKSIGYTDEQLEEILQYPRSKYKPTGIIRHAPGHDDHFHIRFTCESDQRHCR